MWGKIKGFLTGFFTAAKADPVSTGKGLIQIAAAGASIYGMATGVVPVNQLSLGTATALAASGVHAIGTNNSEPVMTELVACVDTAAAMAPQVLSVTDHIQAIHQEAGNAQSTLATIAAAASALSTITAAPAPLAAAPATVQVATLEPGSEVEAADDLEGIRG